MATKGKNDLTVKVTYKLIDGAHFFVSSDGDALGLCVAHADLETAFKEVSHQLNVLFSKNHGVSAKFYPTVPFDDFKQMAQAIGLVTSRVSRGS